MFDGSVMQECAVIGDVVIDLDSFSGPNFSLRGGFLP